MLYFFCERTNLLNKRETEEWGESKSRDLRRGYFIPSYLAYGG